jgi:hypothetical protein
MSLRRYEVEERRQKATNAYTDCDSACGLKSSPEKIIAVKITRFLIH